jgi:hypothetical protein
LKEEVILKEYDTVVISMGVRPRSDLVKAFDGRAFDTYDMGDCRIDRGNFFHAVTDGFKAAMEIWNLR